MYINSHSSETRPDQTLFITGRYYVDNIRRLLNLMTHPKVKEEEAMIFIPRRPEGIRSSILAILIPNIETIPIWPQFHKVDTNTIF